VFSLVAPPQGASHANPVESEEGATENPIGSNETTKAQEHRHSAMYPNER
jgi:hypothetical protein